jgi:copper chaperone
VERWLFLKNGPDAANPGELALVSSDRLKVKVSVMEKAVLTVKGMKCGGCENAIQEAVRGDAGVVGVKVDRLAARVEVEFDRARTNLDAIKKLIAAQGYTVE